MKKMILLAALVLVAGVSFAFLPKIEEPTSYLVVSGNYFAGDATLTVSSAGESTVAEIRTKGKLREILSTIAQAELAKLEELRKSGWTVTHMSKLTQPGFHETTYFLEKH